MSNLIDGDQIRGGTILDSNLTTSGVTPAVYGSSTEGVQFAVSQTGRITSAANVAISGVPASQHDILSVTHGDTTAASGVVGDLITYNVKWTRLVGNTSTTRKFLEQSGNGTNASVPVWTQVKDTDILFTDTTTGNVSITKHGFAPKSPNDASYYLDGTGTYSIPSGTSTPAYDQGARVANSTDSSTTNATIYKVSFDTQRYDTDAIWDIGDPTKLVCNTSGRYVIMGQVTFASSGGGNRYADIYLNNATIISATEQVALTTTEPLVVSTIYYLTSGDYVELRVKQDSGGSLNVLSLGNYSPEFMMERIGNVIIF